MNTIRFSVLMGVYEKDVPEHFAVALQSLFYQTRLPDQIVIVADGPLTARLETVLADHIGRHPDLFTVVRLPENGGPARAWNRGLDYCKFEMVARMDADDICLPERFEKQIEFFQENPEVDVVGSYYVEFGTDPEQPTALYKPPLSHEEMLRYARVQLRNPLCHPSVMFKKDAVIATGKYIQTNSFVDYYLWVRMFQAGYVFANIPEFLMQYRGGENIMARRGGIEYIRNEWAFMKRCYKNGFIDFRHFAGNFFARPIVRLLPAAARKMIYQKLLRHSVP